MAKRNFFQSGNPLLRESTFQNSAQDVLDSGFTKSQEARMTVQGAISKSFILAAILLVGAAIGFSMPSGLMVWGGGFGGLILVVIMAFKPHLSPTLAPLYAFLEGLFLGAFSFVYAAMYAGIVFQAFSLTIAALFAMLFIYKSGIIQVNNRFRTMITMATAAIAVVYLVSFVLSLFGITMPYLHQGGVIGIGISAFVLGIACLNLLLDFDNFERGEQYGAPKFMEWYSAVGLIVTIVWIYLEILRLLAKLRD